MNQSRSQACDSESVLARFPRAETVCKLIGRIDILPLCSTRLWTTMDSATLHNPQHVKRTKLVALIISLSALCVATNYAMIPLSNVKLMDAIVFTAGVAFGFVPGAAVAALSWLVYGTLNPLGFSAPILAIVVLSEMIYSCGGQLIRRTQHRAQAGLNASVNGSVVFGAVGFFCTLAYDLSTNAVSGILSYNSVWLGWATMNFPIPFGIIHEASNLFFFATVVPILLKVLKRTAPTLEGIKGE